MKRDFRGLRRGLYIIGHYKWRILPLLLQQVKVMALYKNCFEIISNRFVADKETTRVTLWNNVKYEIHPRSADIDLIHEIHSENIYHIRKGDIGDNSIVVDIGAQIGVFSVFAAKQAQGVTVYSLEPEPENFQFLSGNIEMNHLTNRVHPINQAVSGTASPRTLVRSATSVSAHSLLSGKFTEGEIRDSLQVECTTLPDIFRNYSIEKCDVLKLDCEGEEFNILLNTPDDILAKIKKIVAEYHDGLTEYTHEDLGDFLRARNFEVETRAERSFPTFTVGFLYAHKKEQE